MRIFNIAGWRAGLLALALVLASGGSGAAQWLSVPIPGTPRMPDGSPNLKAPAPRTPDGKPDLSGIWRAESYQWVNNLTPKGVEPPMLPWAAALQKQRALTMSHELPMTFCMPHGVPDAMFVNGHPWKLVQTPNMVIQLYEEFTKYRQIHTDGRQLPVDPNPTWYGYSVGRWDGDAFVVNSAGFKEGSWITNQGHPHTDALRTTERFRRIDFGYMELVVTVDDAKAYSRPWDSDTVRFFLQPDTELLEHLCENNRDLPRLQKIFGEREGSPLNSGGQR